MNQVLEPADEGQASSARERFDRLYLTLRERICLLDYPPGTRLREEVLAQEFGVSRTPLRRVLCWLESEGLLKSVQGVGTIVTDVELDELAQIYHLRMELAVLLGRLLPVPPDRVVLEHFRELRDRSRRLVEDPNPRAFAQLNMDFFQALMRLTANEPLKAISERLYYQISRVWLKSIDRMDFADEVANFSHEISDILKALELGDLEAVGHIRRSHISMSFARIRAHAGEAPPEEVPG